MSSANDIQIGGDHYRSKGLQHWDLMAEYDVPYLEGNGSKYGYRWPKKNGLEDLNKFRHYVIKVKELFEQKQYVPIMFPIPQEVWHDFCTENGVDGASEHATYLILSWSNGEDLRECLSVIDGIISLEEKRLMALPPEQV